MKEHRTVRTTILLTRSERTQFQAAADREHITLSEFIRLGAHRLASTGDFIFVGTLPIEKYESADEYRGIELSGLKRP